MSGGWFFVVASEVITVGNRQIILPGIGSYIASALLQERLYSVIYAMIAMIIVILVYDQLLIRPLCTWSYKFKYEMNSGEIRSSSWIFNMLNQNLLISHLFIFIKYLMRIFSNIKFPNFVKREKHQKIMKSKSREKLLLYKISDALWYLLLMALALCSLIHMFDFMQESICLDDLVKVSRLTLITLLRVTSMILLASLIWVPIGIWVGLNPSLREIVRYPAQLLSSFPANLLFPVAVIGIEHYHLNHNIWVSPLMIAGSQWYILFNVIAGSSSIPNELIEVSNNFKVLGLLRLRKVIIPGVIPYFITGAVTASGGAWNASIIAEVVTYGNTTIVAEGIGSYIAEMTVKGDFHRIILGMFSMSLCVIGINRCFWQPIQNFCTKKFQC
jgi:NitT/TauT family transport system permease protein